MLLEFGRSIRYRGDVPGSRHHRRRIRMVTDGRAGTGNQYASLSVNMWLSTGRVARPKLFP